MSAFRSRGWVARSVKSDYQGCETHFEVPILPLYYVKLNVANEAFCDRSVEK